MRGSPDGSPQPRDALRHVRRATKRAALASKRKIWDSNDASIDAALTAVDRWEQTYKAIRAVLISSTSSALSMYGAAKNGAGRIEHHLLVPVRDLVIMPAFSGVERAVEGTTGFIQSEEARRLAGFSLQIVRRTPLVGENLLTPALVTSADIVRNVWEVVKYPIPARSAVRDVVDGAMTGTKWAIRSVGQEIYFYAKLVDATVTRTLMHTQWRILGSGPYSSLDAEHRQEVIDHLSERYLSQKDPIGRYELSAHIRANNRKLYNDLVVSGLLLERGGKNTEEDTWLSQRPVYRMNESVLMLPGPAEGGASYDEKGRGVRPLWFALSNQNGERPGKDIPWTSFRQVECDLLEEGFVRFLRANACTASAPETMVGANSVSPTDNMPLQENFDEPVAAMSEQGTSVEGKPAHTRVDAFEMGSIPDDSLFSTLPDTPRRPQNVKADQSVHYPTTSQWYDPNPDTDVLLDQKRQAVSFILHCPNCRSQHEEFRPPLAKQMKYGALCERCQSRSGSPSDFITHPPVSMVMRPTLWRFFGSGDEVRRGVWLLDTKRNGLQPYSDDSAAVLEDAYLFLKSCKQTQGSSIEGVLLTVQVPSPDASEQQLVQFRSLTQVTAITKTLGDAFEVFKRRVYRGISSGGSSSDIDSQTGNMVSGFSSPPPTCENETDAAPDRKNVRDGSCTNALKGPRRRESVSLAAPPHLRTNETWGSRENHSDDGVDHLILVVHGIGEMMRSADLFGLALPPLSSIADCCGWLRRNHADVCAAQMANYKGESDSDTSCPVDIVKSGLGRVEYLPVEWHEAFAIQSRRRSGSDRQRPSPSSPSLDDISLKTIPHLRAFANDTLLDVLFFMSKEYHQTIIDIVTKELNFVVKKFRRLTGFRGRISLMAHSLGSVIAWDILAHQGFCSRLDSEKEDTLDQEQDASMPTPIDGIYDTSHCQYLAKDGKEGPSELVGDCVEGYPQLSFEVTNTFMLGSPVAVFLLIRNHQLRKNFSLPGCSRVFNIFHPYDPAAYRIEPLLDPRNVDIEPSIIAHHRGGFRVQYKTKILWKRLVDKTRRTQQNVIEAVEASLAGVGLVDDSIDDEDDASFSEVGNEAQRVQCGMLNQGRRIDFALQESEIEHANETLFALSAHSSYWDLKDLSLFIARQLLNSSFDLDGIPEVWEAVEKGPQEVHRDTSKFSCN